MNLSALNYVNSRFRQFVCLLLMLPTLFWLHELSDTLRYRSDTVDWIVFEIPLTKICRSFWNAWSKLNYLMQYLQISAGQSGVYDRHIMLLHICKNIWNCLGTKKYIFNISKQLESTSARNVVFRLVKLVVNKRVMGVSYLDHSKARLCSINISTNV